MASDVFSIVGTTVAGAFHVEDVVAEGGFAVVYRAYHSGFRAKVALKCLKVPQYLGREEQRRFQSHFHAEAELLFKLSASIQHVVRPLHVDAITAPDGSFMPFMALEWLEGRTVDVHVRELAARGRASSLSEIVELLTPVARALERAHNFEGTDGPISIVHRDMKPENIFLARVAGEQVVKILDFGIATARSLATRVSGGPEQDEAKPESFTPAYGAPEQWLPKQYGHTGPWTDVWGLALTTVELAVNRPVIGGDHASMMGTAIDAERRPSPRFEGLDVSDAVEAVFQRALAVDPRSRYPDAGRFWADLVLALKSRGPGRVFIPDLDLPGAPARVSSGAPRPPARAAPPSLELDLADDAPAPARAREASPPRPALAPQNETLASVPATEPSRPVRPMPRVIPESLPAPATAVQQFGPPVALLTSGIVVSILDASYAASAGEVLRLGPFRPAWLAAALVLGGVAVLVRRVVSKG